MRSDQLLGDEQALNSAFERWTAAVRHIARFGAICLLVVGIAWTSIRSSHAVVVVSAPGIQIELVSGSGLQGDPHIWRFLMNDAVYRQYLTYGLKGSSTPGQTRPGTWLAATGQYYQLQYIGKRGEWHELRMTSYLQNPPSGAGSQYVDIDGMWTFAGLGQQLRVSQSGANFSFTTVQGSPGTPVSGSGSFTARNRLRANFSGQTFEATATEKNSGGTQRIDFTNGAYWYRPVP
jgi:hypothetical protein